MLKRRLRHGLQFQKRLSIVSVRVRVFLFYWLSFVFVFLCLKMSGDETKTTRVEMTDFGSDFSTTTDDFPTTTNDFPTKDFETQNVNYGDQNEEYVDMTSHDKQEEEAQLQEPEQIFSDYREEPFLFPLAPITLLKKEENDEEFIIPPWNLYHLFALFIVYFVLFVSNYNFWKDRVFIGDGEVDPFARAASSCVFALIMVIIAAAVSYLSYSQGNGPLTDFGISFRSTDVLWGCGCGFSILLVLWGLLFLLVLVLPAIWQETLAKLIVGSFLSNTITEFFMTLFASVFFALASEIVFRGFVFFTLAKQFPLQSGLVLIGNVVFFCVCNLSIGFVAPLLFTFLRFHTKSLTPGMIANVLLAVTSIILVNVLVLIIPCDDC